MSINTRPSSQATYLIGSLCCYDHRFGLNHVTCEYFSFVNEEHWEQYFQSKAIAMKMLILLYEDMKSLFI